MHFWDVIGIICLTSLTSTGIQVGFRNSSRPDPYLNWATFLIFMTLGGFLCWIFVVNTVLSRSVFVLTLVSIIGIVLSFRASWRRFLRAQEKSAEELRFIAARNIGRGISDGARAKQPLDVA